MHFFSCLFAVVEADTQEEAKQAVLDVVDHDDFVQLLQIFPMQIVELSEDDFLKSLEESNS